jgi:hypothetical protein
MREGREGGEELAYAAAAGAPYVMASSSRSCKNESERAFFTRRGTQASVSTRFWGGEQGIAGRLVPMRDRSARNFASFPRYNSKRIQTAEFEPQIPDSVIPSLNSYIQTQPNKIWYIHREIKKTNPTWTLSQKDKSTNDTIHISICPFCFSLCI